MKQKIGEIVEKALEEVNEDADERVDYAKETKLFWKGRRWFFSFVTLYLLLKSRYRSSLEKRYI